MAIIPSETKTPNASGWATDGSAVLVTKKFGVTPANGLAVSSIWPTDSAGQPFHRCPRAPTPRPPASASSRPGAVAEPVRQAAGAGCRGNTEKTARTHRISPRRGIPTRAGRVQRKSDVKMAFRRNRGGGQWRGDRRNGRRVRPDRRDDGVERVPTRIPHDRAPGSRGHRTSRSRRAEDRSPRPDPLRGRRAAGRLLVVLMRQDPVS